MIEVKELTKFYGKKKSLDSVTFTVKDNEILGFLGPNGAGKSTTMNIITGYLSSTSGEVKVDGFDILDEPNEVKKRIGYLPEQPPLYLDMTVSEYLDFVYDLKKAKTQNKQEHIKNIVARTGIEQVFGRRIAHLSKGYRQRVGIAQALIGNPKILILDEPTVGLDPSQIIEIRHLITDLGKEHTVILSSHILSEISAVCQRVIIIKDGKLVAEDTPDNLSKKFSSENRLILSVMGERDKVVDTISKVAGVNNVSVVGGDYEVTADDVEDKEFLQSLFFALANAELAIVSQRVEKASLEDVFIELTKNEEAENESDNKTRA